MVYKEIKTWGTKLESKVQNFLYHLVNTFNYFEV